MDKYTGDVTNKIIRLSIHSLFRVLNFMLPACRINISGVLIVVLPCILINTRLFYQQMYYFIKT